MTVTLEIDDCCFEFTGPYAADKILNAVKQDCVFFVKAADSITVTCLYGRVTEDRT